MTQTPERQEYLRQYRLRKKAEYAAKKAERARKAEEEQANIERTAANAEETPSPPPEATSGKVEDKTDLLNEFLGAVGPKINPRPIQPDEKDQEGEGQKPIEKGAVFIRGSLFRLIGIRLNKMFETKEFELSQEEADCMADALQGGLEYSHVSMNPWAAFGIMVLMWLLPLVWILPAKMGWGKDKKGKKGEQDGQPKPVSDWGLRPNRIFGAKPPTIEAVNKFLGDVEPTPIVPDVPGPGAAAATADAIAARDAKLAVAHDTQRASEDGENNVSV